MTSIGHKKLLFLNAKKALITRGFLTWVTEGNTFKVTPVVYFNQHLGTANSKGWSNFTFSCFLHEKPQKSEKKTRKMRQTETIFLDCTQTLARVLFSEKILIYTILYYKFDINWSYKWNKYWMHTSFFLIRSLPTVYPIKFYSFNKCSDQVLAY